MNAFPAVDERLFGDAVNAIRRCLDDAGWSCPVVVMPDASSGATPDFAGIL